MKTLFTGTERQALDEARKIRASKLQYIHFTDAAGALGMLKEKAIWQSEWAAPAVYAIAVGGTYRPKVQQHKLGRAKERGVAVLFTTNEFPDTLRPEQVMWHKDKIKTTSIKIIPMWKALKMLDGSMVTGRRKRERLVGIPRHPSTGSGIPVRSDEPYPVARVDGP